MKWNDYFLRSGKEIFGTWERLIDNGTRKVLYIFALGFDPRAMDGLQALLPIFKNRDTQLMMIESNAMNTPPPIELEQMRGENEKRLSDYLEELPKPLDSIPIGRASASGKGTAGREVAKACDRIDFSLYTDVIVDVSAQSRTLFIPLLSKLLHKFESTDEYRRKNLHVFTSENPTLDALIQPVGIAESANYIFPYSGGLDLQSARDKTKVWIPILGENQLHKLTKIWTEIVPNDICPLFPTPSKDPRRVDNLLLEFHDFLFDQLEVPDGNLIYASEDNPFEVYRKLVQTAKHYSEVLEPLGGCTVILSALSSKLLSLGAFLAAYEFKSYSDESPNGVALYHVESGGYTIDRKFDLEEMRSKNRLYWLWLHGECYVDE